MVSKSRSSLLSGSLYPFLKDFPSNSTQVRSQIFRDATVELYRALPRFCPAWEEAPGTPGTREHTSSSRSSKRASMRDRHRVPNEAVALVHACDSIEAYRVASIPENVAQTVLEATFLESRYLGIVVRRLDKRRNSHENWTTTSTTSGF